MKKYILFFSFIFALTSNFHAFALSEDLWDYYDTNDIYYYNPENANCETSDGQEKLSSDGSNLSIIGDSITLSAKQEIKKIFPKLEDNQFNAVSGRRWDEGVEILKSMQLKKYVFFALGTNDPDGLTQEQLDTAFNAIGNEKTILLVKNYSTSNEYEKNNQLFDNAATNKSNIKIVDWKSTAKDNSSELLSQDGVHLTKKGKKTFAKLLHRSVNTSSNSTNHTNHNKLYNGDPVFSEEELNKIKANQPFYEKSANKYNFPWQILAVMHRREHGLAKDNPANGQGAYQLYSYTGGGSNSKAFKPAGPISDQEFQRQTDIAAKLIKENYGRSLNLSTDDGIKTLFFRYNGAADSYKAQARSLGFDQAQAERGEGSPYVMNMADEKRDPRKNPNWKMITTDGGTAENSPANITPGAFVMYSALGGSSGLSDCDDSNSISGNGDINQTAIDLAWPKYGEHKKDDPKPAYKKALSVVKLSSYGDANVRIGASCDAFVATVMRFSGVDPDFPCCGAANQLNYLLKSSKYEKVPNRPRSLKPGDIRSYSGHIEIYIEVNGVGKIASASYDERTAEIGGFYNNNYQVFRFKK